MGARRAAGLARGRLAPGGTRLSEDDASSSAFSQAVVIDGEYARAKGFWFTGGEYVSIATDR